jgi:hypothetical protein
MNTSLKVITAALAAVVLATGVASAETASADALRYARAHATSTANGNVHGSSTQTAPATNHGAAVLDDCVHVAFPQCSGGM